jgi:AraC-like DNA-binding protein
MIPLVGVIADLQVSPVDVFAGTGLAVDDLYPGRFVPFGALLALLDQAVVHTGREDLGLLIGARNGLDVLGPAAGVMRRAATLGQALADLAALQSLNSSGAATYIHWHDGQAFVGYGLHDPTLLVTAALHDLTLAVCSRIIFELTDGAVRPREYRSMRQTPGKPRLWAMLGAEIRFGEAETGFYLSPSDLDFPLPSADASARDAALRALVSAPALVANAWTHRTRHALRGSLLEGRSGMSEVAPLLGVEPRTLRRALAREGTTFETVRDGVRLAIARDLLSMSALSIGDLALTLDYSTPSAFIHAFRRWTGQTPAAWRIHRAAGASTQGT